MRADVLGIVFVMAGAAGTAPLLPAGSVRSAPLSAMTQAGEPASTSTTIRDLDTITGTNDGHVLVGRRVEVYAPVREQLNPGVFWTGSEDNRVLVVLDGDDTYEPVLPVGAAAIVSGSVRRVAEAPEIEAWGLTPADRAELDARPIYLRADTVRPVLATP